MSGRTVLSQEVEAEVIGTAHAMAEVQAAEGRAVLLLTGEGWHPGVVGIVTRRDLKFHRKDSTPITEVMTMLQVGNE